jgi:hypothetical protein
MQEGHRGSIVQGMTLWMLTIVIFAAIFAAGTVAIAAGAVWLTRHEPH